MTPTEPGMPIARFTAFVVSSLMACTYGLTGCMANGTTANATVPYTGDAIAPSPTDSNTYAGGVTHNNGNTTGDANNANSVTGTPTPAPTPTLGPSFLTIANDANGVARIMRNGVPFYMIGYQGELPDVTNYCGWTGADMLTALSNMHTLSAANTVRLWFLQSAGGPADWTPFDRAIAAAKANDLVIVATLVNQWGDCEPYVNNVKNYKTIDWYETGYKQANDGYPLAYRDFAQAVVQHYANEPAIAFWQLVNESEARDVTNNSCPSESGAAAAIRAFADDMAALLHATDPNHLVNLGTQDNGYCGVDGNDFQYVHAGGIDLCEVHSYEPGNQPMPTQVQQDVDLCKAINKPIFMGEVGICRNVQPDGTCSGAITSATLQQRATFFRQKFAAAPTGGLSGMLLWQYSPNELDTVYGIFPDDPVQDVMLHL